MNKLKAITNQELLEELCRRMRNQEISEDEFTWILTKIIAEQEIKNYAKNQKISKENRK